MDPHSVPGRAGRPTGRRLLARRHVLRISQTNPLRAGGPRGVWSLSQFRVSCEERDMSDWSRWRSDDELLLASARDPDAFAAFYRRHENAMLLFFLRRTANAELAADLTAEVFAAALGSARRFRGGRGPAVAWLFAIANHKLASSRRRGRVEDRAR